MYAFCKNTTHGQSCRTRTKETWVRIFVNQSLGITRSHLIADVALKTKTFIFGSWMCQERMELLIKLLTVLSAFNLSFSIFYVRREASAPPPPPEKKRSRMKFMLFFFSFQMAACQHMMRWMKMKNKNCRQRRRC